MPDLVLEFIEGGDLLEYIIKHGGLNEGVTRYLARQLCESLKVCVRKLYGLRIINNLLQYIHSKGIAHRDLKPENVLLTTDNPPVLKVADFGLAKAVDSMTKFKVCCYPLNVFALYRLLFIDHLRYAMLPCAGGHSPQPR